MTDSTICPDCGRTCCDGCDDAWERAELVALHKEIGRLTQTAADLLSERTAARRDLTACRSELASIALLLQERMMLPDIGGDNYALVAGAVTRYVLRLEDEYTWEQGQRRALMDNLRSLWVAFGRDPDDEASYVTDHGVGNVIVNDFAVAIRAMRERIEELEAATEALNESRQELTFLRQEETDDLRTTVAMLWDLMTDDQCIRFNSISPNRYECVQDLWRRWVDRQDNHG